jgi:cellulose synthase/poly-beta-1,6-N-acetylglucosamine synthase-like glycosyltransferase
VFRNGFEIVFWLCAAIVAYIYVGYPLLLYCLTRKAAPPRVPGARRLPRVTLLISAYNEAAVIGQKIRNALDLDYPSDRLEVLVISDCSTDGTDQIVENFQSTGVRLVRHPERLGKSAALNLGVARSTGEILIFSDANAMYRSDAVRVLVKHFSNPGVGYVVGNAKYITTDGQKPSAESEGLYWKLETWLKQKESDFGSVVGGDGAIYAIRRHLFTPLLPTDINDFLNPLQIIVRGYRGVYDPEAVCFEEAGDSFRKEFRRKVRIISRGLNAVYRSPAVLLPWVQPRHWFSLVSHKLLRWFVPAFLLTVLFINLGLWQSPMYRLIFFSQAVFYAFAIAGWLLDGKLAAPRLAYLPYYFCLVNTASLLGIIKFFARSLSPTWQTIREPQAAGTALSDNRRPD